MFVGRACPRRGLADSTPPGPAQSLRRRGHARGHGAAQLRPGGDGLLLTLTVDADFADLFAVKERRAAFVGDIAVEVRPRSPRSARRSHGGLRGVLISSTGRPHVTPGRIDFPVVVPARSDWSTCLSVEVSVAGQPLTPQHRCDPGTRRGGLTSPRAHSPDTSLIHTLRTSVRDLGALQIQDPEHPDRRRRRRRRALVHGAVRPRLAAHRVDGAAARPELALGHAADARPAPGHAGGRRAPRRSPAASCTRCGSGADAALALGGGTRLLRHGRRDAAVRRCCSASCAGGGCRRRACVDAAPRTPTARWTGSSATATATATASSSTSAPPTAAWSTRAGRTPGTAINFADGHARRSRRSRSCEVQGYVVRGLPRPRAPRATHAATSRGRALARTGRRACKRRSTSASGCRERGLVRARASTATSDRSTRSPPTWATACGPASSTRTRPPRSPSTCCAREMFTGWGVRTLASDDGRLQPDELPQRLGLAARQRHRRRRPDALRLRRGGPAHRRRRCSTRPTHFGGRLPELFCGFDRAEFDPPVPYPTSCSPQAWAAAAPLLLVRSLLGLNPDVPAGVVRMAPAVPARMLPLRVERDPSGRRAGRRGGPRRRVDRRRAAGRGAARRRRPARLIRRRGNCPASRRPGLGAALPGLRSRAGGGWWRAGSG